MGKLIDIHSHILWGVDDGPDRLEETLQLLEYAVKEGITEIISTSHSDHPYYDVNYQIIINKINLLQEMLVEHRIPITIHAGHEVRLSENIISNYQSNKIHTLANSQYLLLELPSTTVPFYTENIIRDLLKEGITPIIAHPERNKAIAEQPTKLEKLIYSGALAQITAGSIAGHFGKEIQKLSLDLIKANLVHAYGSDVHNATTRPFLFEKGLLFLEKKKQLDAVDILLENNKRIIENRLLIIDEPQKVESTKWWKIY